jgi:hypothetical protein
MKTDALYTENDLDVLPHTEDVEDEEEDDTDTNTDTGATNNDWMSALMDGNAEDLPFN